MNDPRNAIVWNKTKSNTVSCLAITFITDAENCWLVRVSLFIELEGAGNLGTRKRGAFSTFMISRPILHGSNWWKF